MKKTISTLLVSAIIASAAMPAFAAEDQSQFKDYIGLTGMLRSHGVEPVQVAWNDVNKMCSSLNKEDDSYAYNACRYEKALDQFSFVSDREECTDEALGSVPDSLRYPQNSSITNTAPGTTITQVTTQSTPVLNYMEIKAARRSVYNRCMDSKGWRSANNWRLGRKN